MQRVIGIDFGTSTTYMNVKRYNDGQPVEDAFSYMPVMFNYGESSGYVASIVRENADGSFDFGEKAAEQLDGARVYREFKMRLESPDAREQEEARRITQRFFCFLYTTYAQQAGNLGAADDTEETIVSYPVKWQAETAAFMLEAARAAGFRNVTGVDEAAAAVSTVLCQNAGSNLLSTGRTGYLMLIDMGAGTTDLAVCRYQFGEDGSLGVGLVTNWPQSADEPTFGGREIDTALEKYVEDYLNKALNPELAVIAHQFAASPGQAKLWKERNVSVTLAAGKPVTTCAYISACAQMLSSGFPAFDRPVFEKLICGGLQDYAHLVRCCLDRTAALDPDFAAVGVDLVILTGGHSSWYFAREIIDGTMAGYLEHPMLAAVRRDKSRTIGLPNPQMTVSLGLIYSKLLLRQEDAAEETRTEESESSGSAENAGGAAERQMPAANGQTWDQAAIWVRKTARKGYAGAQAFLGGCVEKGKDIKKDLGKALDQHSAANKQTGRYSIPAGHPDNSGACADGSNGNSHSETAGMHRLTLTRMKQWAGAVTKLHIKVDQSDTYEMRIDDTISIPLSHGGHSLFFSFPSLTHAWVLGAAAELDISRDMDLTVKADCNVIAATDWTMILYEGTKIVGKYKMKMHKL